MRNYKVIFGVLSAVSTFVFTPAKAEIHFLESAEDTYVTTMDGNFTADRWEQIINTDNERGVLFGIRLLGPNPYARNAEVMFPPASNTKLFTMGAALKILGGDYRIPTKMTWQRVFHNSAKKVTQLKLYGYGDPTWGMSEHGESLRTRIDTIVEALKEEGVKEVHGPIEVLAADPRWDYVRFPEGWDVEDHTRCYGAQAQAFNLNINCATYVVRGLKSGGWKERGVPIPVELDIKRGRSTELTVEAIHLPKAQAAKFKISGTLSKKTSYYRFVLPVHDTKQWIKNLFQIALKDKAIKLVKSEPSQKHVKVFEEVFYSPSVKEIIVPFMKKSINVTGEALFKHFGMTYEQNDVDLLYAGQEVMKDYINEIGVLTSRNQGVGPGYGFFAHQVVLWDGSGVSRDNRVTTTAVMALLRDFLYQDDFDDIWDSLPIAGVDGTLKYRMKNTAAYNVLRAKTGTLTGVYNLSGYVPRLDQDGVPVDYVPFVTLSKTDGPKKNEARGAQDRVGAALAELINPPQTLD